MGACCACTRTQIALPSEEEAYDDKAQLLNGEATTPRKHKNSDLDEHDDDVLLRLGTNKMLVPTRSCLSSAKNASDESRRTEGGNRVRFARVNIREYNRCIDYHPCVSSGVPLGLDWAFEEIEVWGLNRNHKFHHCG